VDELLGAAGDVAWVASPACRSPLDVADTFSQFDRHDVRVAKTASRRTLGFMKEMAFELEWHIAHDGGLDATDINELNHALRRTLRSHGSDYTQPIELVNQHLTTRGRPAGAP